MSLFSEVVHASCFGTGIVLLHEVISLLIVTDLQSLLFCLNNSIFSYIHSVRDIVVCSLFAVFLQLLRLYTSKV
jgi:hypothetical protein